MAKELKVVCEEWRAEIRSELRKFGDTVERDLRRKSMESKNGLTFGNQMYEETKWDLGDMKFQRKKLKFNNYNLQTTCNELTKLVKSNTGRLQQLQQYSWNAYSDIKGIPIQPEKNLIRLLGKLSSATNGPIPAADVEVCHRVSIAGKSSKKNIIVLLSHRAKRNTILEMARRLLRFAGTGSDLRQQLSLSRTKNKLLGQVSHKKREQG